MEELKEKCNEVQMMIEMIRGKKRNQERKGEVNLYKRENTD